MNSIFTIKESKIHGLGCFATTLISPGSVIIEYKGEVIGFEEAIRRNKITSEDYSIYILDLNGNFFIDGAKSGNESRFINHCCHPNCCIRREDGHAYIVALEKIHPGEELTIDYSYNAHFHESCSCKAVDCRGYI